MSQAVSSDVRTIFACLSRRRRRELGLLAAVMPATALAEALTVAAIVPFVALLSGQRIGVPVDAVLHWLAEIGPDDPLLVAGGMFATVVLVTATLRLSLSWLSKHFAFGLGHEVSVEIQRRFLFQPYSFHVQRHSSEQLAALNKVDLLVFDLAIQGIQALSAVLIGALLLAILIVLDPLNALVATLFIGAFYAVASAIARNRLRLHGGTINSSHALRAKFVQESSGGIRDLILDHSQEAALDRFRALDAAFAQARTRTAFIATAPRFLIEAVGLIVIALLAMLIAGRGGGLVSALPFLGALALGAMRLLPLMSQMYSSCASLAVARPILNDVADLLCLPMQDGANIPEPVKFHRSIEFKAVSFNYPDRSHRAVDNLTLVIPKGARVAVAGRTGSGKSTLVDILMGLIEPTGGSVLLDEIPLSDERIRGWRRSIAHVPQKIFLADDSIAANIALSFHGGVADLDRIKIAAGHAQLHEFIESLPEGYDTCIGERGIRLSGGQRQRLALARALYKQAPVLVLDEPTSALDEQTETAILEAMDELQSRGTTIVIVGHRLSTMRKCDLVYVLEEGRLVKSGSYSQLFGEAASGA